MARQKKSWLSASFSFLLLLLTYGAGGLLYGSWIKDFPFSFLNAITETSRFILLYGLAVAGIIMFVFLFASPISLATICLNSWFKSDTRAFLSIFFAAFVFAIAVQRVDYFVRFLVLAAAAFLFKLDLQLLGFNSWLCTLSLNIFCWLGFSGGILASYRWSF
ncbi:MAG: hypothetical protein AAFQ80_00580 [Cyanobacteria bacterium J06621_8]